MKVEDVEDDDLIKDNSSGVYQPSAQATEYLDEIATALADVLDECLEEIATCLDEIATVLVDILDGERDQ